MATKRGKATGAKKKRMKDLDPKGRSKKVKGGGVFASRDSARIVGNVNDALYTFHDGIKT